MLCGACEVPPSGPSPSVASAPEQAPDLEQAPASASEARSIPLWMGYIPAHWLPGPHDPRAASKLGERAELERGCPGCHGAQAEHWQGSQHASAWSSAAFQRSFALEPLIFCQGCHAPEASTSHALADAVDSQSAWAAQTGVGCVTCHVEPGEARIWTAGDELERDLDGGCVLPISRSPAFAGPQSCAACHEFEFPEPRPGSARALLVQSTIAEHAASARAERSCIDCHMPSERGHAFPGAYDRGMLSRALEIEARRDGDALTLALRPGAVGHAVPTGDLFRRLEVAVSVVDRSGDERVVERRWLGRRFGPHATGDGFSLDEELGDERVGPEGRTLRFALREGERDQTLRWRVVHQRVAHFSADGREAVIDGELEIASGRIEPNGD